MSHLRQDYTSNADVEERSEILHADGHGHETPRLTPSASLGPSLRASPLNLSRRASRDAAGAEDNGVRRPLRPPDVDDNLERGPHGTSPSPKVQLPSILVISGGSGYNDLVGATPDATFVMPISDNGGSSSEIIRVLGGPSIGDLRSRLVRLIPTSTQCNPMSSFKLPASNDAIHALLSYRLPTTTSTRRVKQEWMDLLEGRHRLWRNIEPERKELIRGFLVQFEAEVLRHAHRRFNFEGGSIGNFFLSSAQKFFRSIQSAIFLFASITHIPQSHSGKVIPVINTNHTATIAAELEDGETIVGQCEISHPAAHGRTWRVGGEVPIKREAHPPARGRGLPEWAALLEPAEAWTDGAAGSSSHIPGTPCSAVFDPLEGAPPEAKTLERGAKAASSLAATSQFGASVREGGPGSAPSARSRQDAARWKGFLTLGYAGDGLEPGQGVELPRREASGTTSDEEDVLGAGLDDAEDDGDAWQGSDDETSDWGPYQTRGSSRSRTADVLRSGTSSNIFFTKGSTSEVGSEGADPPLSSPIERIFYVNAYGNEVYPAPNPDFVRSLRSSRVLIYSCGSLWTSIVPCLCLRGVASLVAGSEVHAHRGSGGQPRATSGARKEAEDRSDAPKYKLLLLNTWHDRETRGLSAVEFVKIIHKSLCRSDKPGSDWTPRTQKDDTGANAKANQVEQRGEGGHPYYRYQDFVTHLLYFPAGRVEVDVGQLESMGVRAIALTRTDDGDAPSQSPPRFTEASLREGLNKVLAE